jgi:hypothetical protein
MDDASTPAPMPMPTPVAINPSLRSIVVTSTFGTPVLGGLDAKSIDNVPWPKPDRSTSPFEGDRLYLGLESGIGTPAGYGGVVAAWDPSTWFEIEAGVGLGGKFGTGLGGMVHLEIPLLDTWRMGLGLGYSDNFLSASARAPDGEYANAPKTSHWLNLQFIEMDIATGKTGFIRFFGGYSFLLNRGDYSGACPAPTGSSYDASCEAPTIFPASPRSYGAEHGPPFVPYVGIEYEWRIL